MKPAAESWRLLTRLGLGLALAGLVLAYCRDLRALYGLPKLACLGAGAALAWLGLLWGALGGGLRLRRTPLDLPLAGCAAALAFSAAGSWDTHLTWFGVYNHYFLGLVPLGLCAAVYQAAAQSGEGDRPAPLLRVVLAALALCGLHGVGQAFFWNAASRGGLRVSAALAHPAFLASALIVAVPLGLHFLLSRAGRDRFFGAVCLCAASAGLLFTFSRSGWLGAAAAAAAYLVLSGRLPLSTPQARKTAGLVAALVLAAGLSLPLLARGGARSSDSERRQIWASALQVIRGYPLLGTGPDTFELSFRRHKTAGYVRASKKAVMYHEYAHNDLLQAAATLGLVGLTAYLWLCWALVRLFAAALSDPLRRDGAAAGAGALLGLFLQAKVNPLPLASLGLAAALAGLSATRHGPEAGKAASAAVSGTVLAALAAALFFILGQVRADVWQLRALKAGAAGRVQEAAFFFDKAVALDPLRVEYRADYTRLLYRCAEAAPGPVGLGCLARAEQLGRQSSVSNPNQVDAWQIVGTTLLEQGLSGAQGKWAEAGAALERAQELDPFFLPVLKSRVRLAQQAKDEAKVAALRREFETIYALTK